MHTFLKRHYEKVFYILIGLFVYFWFVTRTALTQFYSYTKLLEIKSCGMLALMSYGSLPTQIRLHT